MQNQVTVSPKPVAEHGLKTSTLLVLSIIVCGVTALACFILSPRIGPAGCIACPVILGALLCFAHFRPGKRMAAFSLLYGASTLFFALNGSTDESYRALPVLLTMYAAAVCMFWVGFYTSKNRVALL